MADYSSVLILSGDVGYPEKINNFMDLTEAVATEVENARENYTGVDADTYKLINNLQNNYINYIPKDMINGSTEYKFINMGYSISPRDYITVKEAKIELGSPDISGVAPITSSTNSMFIVSQTKTEGGFTYFNYEPQSVVDEPGPPSYPYVPRFNALYYLDWDTYAGQPNLKIRLDSPSGIIPTLTGGERLYFVFLNPQENQGLIDQTRGFIGDVVDDELTFGLNMDTDPPTEWNYAILDLINPYNTYWEIKNVILG